jgi:hypothetical protein
VPWRPVGVAAGHGQRARGRISIHGHLRGRDDRVRAHPLQAVNHDPLILLQTRADDPQSIHHGPKDHGPVSGLIRRIHHHDVLLVLVRAHGTVIDQDRWSRRLTRADLRVEAGRQFAVGIIENRPNTDGSRRRIEAVIDRLQVTLVRVGIFIGQPHGDQNVIDPVIARRAGRRVFEEGLLVHLEFHVDRIDRDDRREYRGVRPCPDQVALGDFRAGDPTSHRRGDGGVIEIDLRGLHGGLRGLHAGVGLQQRIVALIQIAL